MQKRFVGFLILFIAAAVLFSSCAVQTKEEVDLSKVVDVDQLNGLTLPISKKNQKLTILTESVKTNQNDSVILEALRKITGLNLQIIPVKLANVEQTLQTMIASKQLPDIFYCFIDQQTKQVLANNKTIAPVDQYLSIMPNYKKLVIEDPENYTLIKNSALADGHIYQIDTYGISRNINHCFMYRKDIFEKHGLKPWTNTQEFYETLKELKRLYPDSVPFTIKLKDFVMNYLRPQWGIVNSDFVQNPETGQWEYGNTSFAMKELMSFLVRLHREELLDQDFLTISDTSWMTRLASEDQAFVTFDWVDRLDMVTETMRAQGSDYELAMGYPIGLSGKYKNKTTFTNGGAYAIANNANTEYSMKLMDFLISNEGAKFSTLGIEGVTFSYEDEAKEKVSYIGFEGNENINIQDLEERYGLFIPAIAIRFDSRSAYFQYTKRVAIAQEQVMEHHLLTEKLPYFEISPLDKKMYEDTKFKIDLAFNNFFPKFFAENHRFEELWNQWLSEAKGMNSDFLNQVIQASPVSFY